MTAFMKTTTYIRGMHGLRENLRITVRSPEALSFSIVVACDSVEPQRWHGEVTFGGTTVLTTGPVDNDDDAVRQARAALNARVVELFT